MPSADLLFVPPICRNVPSIASASRITNIRQSTYLTTALRLLSKGRNRTCFTVLVFLLNICVRENIHWLSSVLLINGSLPQYMNSKTFFSADSTKGRAPPAIDFGSWSSTVYSRGQAPRDLRAVHSTEAVYSSYGSIPQVRTTVITAASSHLGFFLPSLGSNQYLVNPTIRQSAP